MAETYYSLTDIVKLCDNLIAALPPSFYSGIMTVRTELANIPAADVVPVRHGRWKWELADNGWANHICSECGYTKNTDVHVRMDYSYCPNCGALMDKDGDGE